MTGPQAWASWFHKRFDELYGERGVLRTRLASLKRRQLDPREDTPGLRAEISRVEGRICLLDFQLADLREVGGGPRP